jgi:hypothetical protein
MVDEAAIKKTFRKYFDGPGFKTSAGALRVNSLTGKVTVLENVFLWQSPPDGVLPVEFERVNFSMQIQRRHLKSLEGCPEQVRVDFNCSENQLTTLVGGPKKVGGDYRAHHNPLASLEGLATEIGGLLLLTYSTTLPLLRALVAQEILFGWEPGTAQPPFEIMKKYAGTGKRGVIRCQKELIQAGFEGNARW